MCRGTACPAVCTAVVRTLFSQLLSYVQLRHSCHYLPNMKVLFTAQGVSLGSAVRNARGSSINCMDAQCVFVCLSIVVLPLKFKGLISRSLDGSPEIGTTDLCYKRLSGDSSIGIICSKDLHPMIWPYLGDQLGDPRRRLEIFEQGGFETELTYAEWHPVGSLHRLHQESEVCSSAGLHGPRSLLNRRSMCLHLSRL